MDEPNPSTHQWPPSLSKAINQPITWKTVIRVALIWGPEYVILGYLEGASWPIKLATVICCGVGLLVLESEATLKSKSFFRIRLFWPFATIPLAVWIIIFCWVTFHRDMILKQLDAFYIESTEIAKQQRSSNVENTLFSKKVNEWEQKIAAWLTDKIDLMTADQFLDRPAPFTLSYTSYGLHSGWQDCNEVDYLCNRDRLEFDRRNLAEIKKAIEHE